MSGLMTTNDSSNDALTAVISMVNARVCSSCHTRAAVRVGTGVRSGDPASHASAMSLNGDMWFCFECGHEEQAID